MTPPAERSCAAGISDSRGERATPALETPAPGPAIARMPIGRRLSPAERARLVLEIVASYRDVRRSLSTMPIEAIVETLRGGAQTDPGRGTERELLGEAWRLGRAVQLTLRLLPGDTRCLTRSLVLTQLLARRGIPAKLVIGTRAKPSFSAHAWVEQAGSAVLPAGECAFGRLVEL